jgi:chromosome partitioning protein
MEENIMKIISFAAIKGGCGKSMMTYNIAGELSKQGKRVLLLDGDIQANLSNHCGIENRYNDYESITDIFDKGLNPAQIILKNPMVKNGIKNIDLIASTMKLQKTESDLNGVNGKEFILQNYIKKYKEYFDANYDYLLCDTSPYMTTINYNILQVSDRIILVTEPTIDGLYGIEILTEIWGAYINRLPYEAKNNIKGIIINMFKKKEILSKDFMKFVKSGNELAELFFDTLIYTRTVMPQSRMEHMPVSYFSPNSDSSGSLNELVEEMYVREVL